MKIIPSPSQRNMSFFRVPLKSGAVPPRIKQSLNRIFTRDDPRHDVKLLQDPPTIISIVPARRDCKLPKIIWTNSLREGSFINQSSLIPWHSAQDINDLSSCLGSVLQQNESVIWVVPKNTIHGEQQRKAP